ncbi:hypothetical protein JOJ86_002904 [Rhodococcus percolatus]|nr:hypothetical protein [Rhodococcus opacus]
MSSDLMAYNDNLCSASCILEVEFSQYIVGYPPSASLVPEAASLLFAATNYSTVWTNSINFENGFART